MISRPTTKLLHRQPNRGNMIAQTADHAAAARAIACFTALHCPDDMLKLSADADDYDEHGTAIIANLRDIAELIKQATRIVH